MDEITYRKPSWWDGYHDDVLFQIYHYIVRKEKKFTGPVVGLFKLYLIKEYSTKTMPKSYSIFWDPHVELDFKGVEANKKVFKEFDVGFLAARMKEIMRENIIKEATHVLTEEEIVEQLKRYSEVPFENHFTSEGMRGAMCPDCLTTRRLYQIVKDVVFENGRCATCGTTDYIYIFDKPMSDLTRANSIIELVHVFKEAAESRKTMLEGLGKDLKKRAEKLMEKTGLRLCKKNTLFNETESQLLPESLVENILPSGDRRLS